METTETEVVQQQSTDAILQEVLAEDYQPLTKVLDMITPELTVIPNVMVTPDMARDLLSRNSRNRPLRLKLVARYENQIKLGNWLFCGNTAKFDKNGYLLDAQHQLLAGIRTETTLPFNIQLGLEPDAFSRIDNNQVRTGGDVLAIEGYSDAPIFASAIKSLIYYETIGRLRTNIQFATITNAEIEQWVKRTNDMKLLEKCVTFIMNLRREKKGLFVTPSTWVFVYFLLSKQNRAEATEFIGKVMSGENLSMKTTPAAYLLNQELASFNERHPKEMRKGGIAVTELKVRYIFRAWNALRTNEPITKLAISASGGIEKPV